MRYPSNQPSWRAVLEIAAVQNGVVGQAQLRLIGFSARAVKRLIAKGLLHPCSAGAYAVGRPDLTELGQLSAAVLVCEPDACVSHRSAAWLLGVSTTFPRMIEVSTNRKVVRNGIVAHRRYALGAGERTVERGIAVTSPARTLADLSLCLPVAELERAINHADRIDLIHPPELRDELDAMRGPGVPRLRRVLDARTFTLTDSELERLLLPIAAAAGLPPPLTQRLVCGRRADFFWPDLGLVVETDGLRYHRTAASQSNDLERDHRLAAAGIERLRFSHAQVAHDPRRVERILRAVARRLVTQGPARGPD